MGRAKKLPAGLWKRGDTYYARFNAGGRQVRERLSTNYDAAVEILNDLRARHDKMGRDLIDNDCPWRELRAEFMKWARQALRRPKEYEGDLDRFAAFAAITSIRQITPALVMGYREHRLGQFVQGRKKLPNGEYRPLDRRVTPRTVNREVGTLSNMLNKGVEWRRIGSNAIKGLKPLRHDTPTKERRSLNEAEVQRLFDASPEHLKPVWRMFASTAVRRTELVSMKFADIDFDARTVTVRAATAKNHKAREIPLGDTMLAMLATLKAEAKHRQPVKGSTPQQTAQQAAKFSREHVFVTRANTPLGNNLLSRFYAICAKAGIEDAHRCGSVDLHALRGTSATLMMQGGANPRQVQAILGHSTLAMTMRVYAKATQHGMRAAVAALPFDTVTTPDTVATIPVPKKHTGSTSSSEPRKSLEIAGFSRRTG